MNRKIMIVDVAEDEVEVMMSRIMRSRRRKMMMLRMIMLRPKTGPTLCASLRSRNAHQHVTRAILYRNIQEKLTPTTLCASLRSRNAHQHVTRAILYTDVYRKNAAPSWSTLIKHSPASTITVTTPQCKHRKYSGFWLLRRKKHRHGFLLREFRKKGVETTLSAYLLPTQTPQLDSHERLQPEGHCRCAKLYNYVYVCIYIYTQYMYIYI